MSDANLARLAEAYGVATEYWDQGGQLAQVSAATVEAVLAALGVHLVVEGMNREQAIESALAKRRLRDWRRMLPPCFVTRSGEQRRLWVHVPDGDPVSVHVDLEDGTRRHLEQLDWYIDPVEIDGLMVGEASFSVPGDLPLGWHTIVAVSGEQVRSAPLAMTPRRLDPSIITGERQWGFMTQLYATRSMMSWGLGDLHDAAALAAWSGRELGAGFLLINPLHAASPIAPMAPSPYLPVTRRFVNPIYLRVEDVPEYAQLGVNVRIDICQSALLLQRLNQTEDLLDRDAVWAAKARALASIYALGLEPARTAEFDAYCQIEAKGLQDFALWCAITEVHGSIADAWPVGLSNPDAAAVVEFKEGHADRIRFHCWLQWQLDQQLAHSQAMARDSGMAIGLMQDLAVGVHPEGADAWSLAGVLAAGVSVGAPPDMYNQVGQDWSQPPWHPEALAEAGFGPYRDMLRTVLRHAGGLRIDHVLGMFRLWWVPAGMPASAGTFVRYDFDAMLGILCLEAHRAGAIVVGEDLGTVESWVQDELADRGILGTSILWFESDAQGGAKPPEQWRVEVLASVSVHDLPPTAGYLRDEHVRIRADLDLLTRPVEEETAAAVAERESWIRLLLDSGLLGPDYSVDDVVVALHRAVAASPARLIGVALPDAVGDLRAQNQPGTDQEYPNWRVPMTDAAGVPVVLEDVFARPDLLGQLVSAVRGEPRTGERLGLRP